MLDLTRKVYTPRPGLTHIIQLWKSNTRMCRNRGTVANDIMTDLLVSIQIKLNNPFEQLGLQTEIHLLRHFPLQIRIRISLYNPVNRWSASRFRIQYIRQGTHRLQKQKAGNLNHSVVAYLAIRNPQLQKVQPMSCPVHKGFARYHIRQATCRE